jgi:CDP-diacylglycerol pyrophosphatase
VVNLAHGGEKGYAVLKDNSPTKPFHYLLIPTARITGIESQDLLFPDAPNYFADAWRQRTLVAKLAKKNLARRDYALAVNSTSGRTQNQLHIQIDCVKPEVRKVLASAKLTTVWRKLDTPLDGHHYFARRIRGDAMVGENPFTLLVAVVLSAQATDVSVNKAGVKLFALADACTGWPAHDYRGRTASSIGEEKAHNPRLGGGRTKEEFVETMTSLGLPMPRKIGEAVPANMKCGIE